MDVHALRFLLEPSGQRLLSAAMAANDGRDLLALNLRLRRLDESRTAEQVAAALTLVSLRQAGAAKFGSSASTMFFTAAGLEQATAPAVAEHRAERAVTAGARTCVDLGCGIGSDLLAMARAGLSVTGVERDPVTAEVASANLSAFGLSGHVLCAAAEDVDLGVRAGVDGAAYDLVFADPSRRRGTTRVFDPAAFSPPWTFIATLMERAAGSARQQQAAVKLSPGLDHSLIPPQAEAEWVSLDGELKETTLWSPAPATARRRATLLTVDGGSVERTERDAGPEPSTVGGVGRYVYEPDPAVIRAHLVSVVVAEVGGWLLDPHIAYVAADQLVPTPVATCYRVVDVLPFQEKRLRAALRQRNIGVLTIKKRGVAVTPEELRRRLALSGDEAATLILTRSPGSAIAMLVERVERVD